MYWRRAAALLLAVGALDEAAAKLITITEHVSACSAIYTSASRSVTVVKSTITVSPVPWTDNAANSGTPFVLEAQNASPGSKQKRLAAPKLYVTPEGKLTTHGSLAAQYVIQDGKLTTVHGGWMSTKHGVVSKQFAISTVVEPIQETFVVQNGILNWNNAGFSHGSARLYRRDSVVIALFSGKPSPNWKQILLGARPASDATGGGSGAGTSSISISTAISIGSMSYAPGSTGGHSSIHSGSSGKQYSASGTKVSSAKSSSSSHISPSGICGPASGFSCAAEKCCSSYGYCGIGDTYCGTGCQPEYGICSAVPSSSKQGAASTSVRSMSSSRGQMSMSSMSNGGGSMSHPTSSMPMSAGSTMSSSASPFASSSSSSRTSHAMSTYTATATPIGGNNPGASPGLSTISSTTSVSMAMSSSGSMSSVNPMSSSNAAMSSSSMGSGSTMVSMSSSSMSMPGMSSTYSSAMPSSTLPVSPNGHCGTQGNGGTPDGYTCSGSVFGMCCSNSGFCGNTTDYCLAGCQTAYGSCTVQTGNPITVSGHCGPTAGNQTCTGGIFGPCCSTSGFCGSTADYCAPGNCDPMFGTCNSASSSTMQMSSTSSSMPMSSSMVSSQTTSSSSSQRMSSQTMSSSSRQGMSSSTMWTPSSSSVMLSSSSMASSSSAMMSSSSSARSSSMSSSSSPSSSSSSMMIGTATSSSSSSSGPSSTSSSATPTFTPTSYDPQCPAYNGTGFTDTMGNTYVVLCDKNTDPGAFASSIEPDLASCINMCSSYSSPACVAVTYVGGNCYFKSAYTGDPNSPGTDAAVLASVLGQAPVSYNPFQPTSTSSSSAQTSSMSSPSSSITSAPSSSSTIAASSTTSTSTSTGPYLILTSPTPCDFGDPPDYDEDDSYCEIDLPFAMRIYAQTSTQTYASTNGYLSIQEGSSQYEAMQFPTDELPNNTVAPFFDDLYLYGGQSPQQGIFYQFNPAETAISYEYYLQRAGNAGAPYHFVVAYDSALPGMFTYTYYSVGPGDDDGMYAAVGMQGINGAGTEQGFTYSFQSPDITPGLVVQCDTNANTCTTVGSGGGKLRR